MYELYIKEYKNQFIGKFKFNIADTSYTMDKIFDNPSILEHFYNICNQDILLMNLLQQETIFFDFNLGYDDLVHILNKLEFYESKQIAIMLPKTITPKCKMEIGFGEGGNTRLIDKVKIGNIILTKDDLNDVKQVCKDLMYFKGTWIIGNKEILECLLYNEKTAIDTLLAIKDSKIYELSMLEDPIKGRLKSIVDRKYSYLKQYQNIAFNTLKQALKHELNILLADDMGLGKTITSIAFSNHFIEERQKKVLIVCPKVVLLNWQSEFKKFANIDANIYDGKIDSTMVYITTYGHIRHNPNLYLDYEWGLIILDEAQNIKNHKTQISNIICSLKSDYNLALTGTPLENSVMDLWSIFQFLDSKLLGDYKSFKDTVKTEKALEQLQILISPYLIRRVKEDKTLGFKLPNKNFKIIDCYLNEQGSYLYNMIIDEFKKSDGKNVLSYINLLKQICNSSENSNKLQVLKDYVLSINDDKFIVFTQFVSTAKLIYNTLSSIGEGRIISGTQSAKERQKIAQSFQKGEYKFLIITIKAGNAGLTLTKANHVIHYDRWWNPSVENQATDRVHRIGQDKDVHVIKMIVKNTIEDKIDQILKDKTYIFNKVINNLNKQTAIEIMQLEG